MWNAISLVQNLNSCRRVHFQWTITITPQAPPKYACVYVCMCVCVNVSVCLSVCLSVSSFLSIYLRCEIQNSDVVYILSDVSRKVLWGFGFSTSDPFALLFFSGLIEPWNTYHELAMPRAILNSEKKNVAKPKLFNGKLPITATNQ